MSASHKAVGFWRSLGLCERMFEFGEINIYTLVSTIMLDASIKGLFITEIGWSSIVK